MSEEEEDYYTTTLVHVSPALTNERVSNALTKWFAENVTFTHWEVSLSSQLLDSV